MEEELPVNLRHVQGRMPKDRCSHDNLRLKADYQSHKMPARALPADPVWTAASRMLSVVFIG